MKYPEHVNFRLTAEMKVAMRKKAEQEDRNVGQSLRRLVRAWLREGVKTTGQVRG